MNQELPSHGELARPVINPAAYLAAAPQAVARVVSTSVPAAPRTGSAPALTSMGMLRALRRRQTLALGVALLLTGIAGPAAWLLVPPAKFKAQARLQLAAEPPKVLFRTVETDTNEDYKRYQNTQQTLVKSQFVLNAAIQDKTVKNYRMVREQLDPITWLKEALQVEFLAASEVMEISLTGNSPDEIAGLVNAVKKAYMEEVVNVDAKRRADRHSTLVQIQKKYGEYLKERRENLRRLAETAGSDDRQTLAYRQQIAMDHVAHIRNELMDVQSQKRKAEARLKTRLQPGETAVEPVIDEEEINQLIDRSPAVAQLEAQLAQEESQLNTHAARVRSTSRAGDSLLKRLHDSVVATRRLLKNKRAELRPIAIRQLQEQDKSDHVTQGHEEEQTLAMLADLEQRLNAELKSVCEGNRSLTVNTLDLQALQEEVAQIEDAAKTASHEVESLKIEMQAPPRIRPIEDAVPPLSRDEKKRFAVIGLIIFGSFFGGLFGVAFLELQTQKVDSADEVPADLGLQVVGTLPILRARALRGGRGVRRLREKDRYWRHLLLESIDATRTMLVHAAHTGSHRVVMITSAVSGEGKTSLASHLATSLARSGLRTVLIDADLRSPSIHPLFDLPVAAGLCELIRGEVDLAHAIRATAIEELKVLTAGRCDRNTIRLLTQGCLGPVFGQLKEQFDFVIVDSSPILPVADASIVGQQVDAVLFSIFRDVSRKTKVFAALQRLQSLDVRVLGAVVTGSHGGAYGNDYDSGGHYALLPESAADREDLTS